MTTRQYLRSAKVVVGQLDVSALHVTFSTKHTLKSAPNTAEITVFNAGEATRNEWSTNKNPTVRLDVGYAGGLANIFAGGAAFVESVKKTNTIETTINAGDGEKELRASRIAKQVPAKVSPGVLLRVVAESLGVSAGNLHAAVSKLESKGLGSMFSAGAALSGSTWDLMDRVCASYGLEWSVQAGALQILERDTAADGKTVVKITPDTGLTGSPSVDSKGVLSFECLLNPQLRPGCVVVLESMFVRGGFRITEVVHEGDNFGGPWKSTCKGKRY